MVKIRLARVGTRNAPHYFIVVADARSRRNGPFKEKLGSFNPLTESPKLRLQLNLDRVNHWIDVGAQPTDRAMSLIKEARKTLSQASGA